MLIDKEEGFYLINLNPVIVESGCIVSFRDDAIFQEFSTEEELAEAYKLIAPDSYPEEPFEELIEEVYIPPYNYVNLRVSAYPSIQEQLDMQYKDAINGTTDWVDLISSIKEKYPTIEPTVNQSEGKQNEI